MTAFDTLFWFLVVTLAVVAYAIEAGVAMRHRPAVLCSMFSVVGAILYIMVIGDRLSFGRVPAMPGVDTSLPEMALPKLTLPPPVPAMGIDKFFRPVEPVRQIERIVPKGPFADCEHCPSMIAVPAGSFVMGSAATEPGHNDTEGPVQVTINYPFGVGRFEVTRDQFAAFIDDTKHVVVSGCLVGGKHSGSANWLHPGFEQAGNHPVVCVSWRDAKAYVEWLSRKTGRTYRLLSEAEWEYMARGGEVSTYALGPVLLAAHANFNRARDGTIPIGFTSANAFGVHDVHGNAWEMVEDCWNSDLNFNSRNGRATTWRGDCSERAIRGGGWNSTALQSRLAARIALNSTVATNTVGFRVALTFD